jgi:hypothetical protein
LRRAGTILLVPIFSFALVGPAFADEFRPGQWSAGAGVGFLGNTPDGTAFALNANADYFVHSRWSVGPLMQLGVTGDMTLIAFSGQAKYWWDIPDTNGRAKLVAQGGIGFVHADVIKSDTSWIIPLGLGLDYAITQRIALTTTFLLNFTDLNTCCGNDAHVMPGLTFGVRF